jgi:hypothetical protein
MFTFVSNKIDLVIIHIGTEAPEAVIRWDTNSIGIDFEILPPYHRARQVTDA